MLFLFLISKTAKTASMNFEYVIFYFLNGSN